MTEVVSSSVAANVVSTTFSGMGVIIFGFHTGLDYQTLMAGFAGGATALSYSKPAKPIWRFLEVCSASILAGYSSPMLAELMSYKLFKWEMQHSPSPLPGAQLIIAFMVAYLAHGILLPGIRKLTGGLFRRSDRV